MKKLILLPLALILFAAPMAVDLLVEDFDSGSLPSGWQVWEEEPKYKGSWYFYNYNFYYYEYRYDASRWYGYCWPDHGYPGDDSWLVTPTLDMTGYENLQFSCLYAMWDIYNYSFERPEVHVMGSLLPSPGPGAFFELLDMGDPPYNYEERIADASYFDDEADVTFAIRYEGTEEGWINGILIDDVLVTGDPIVGIESASLGEIKAIYR